MRTLPTSTPATTIGTLRPTPAVAALLARGAALGPPCEPPPYPAARADRPIPAQQGSAEQGPAQQGPAQPVAAARDVSRERSSVSAVPPFAALGYAMFALQRPGALTGVPTLEQALAAPRTGRAEERRGAGPRIDAFSMLGEIGFLDF